MSEPKMRQKEWPKVGRYIGEQNPPHDCDLLEAPVLGDSEMVKCFLYQMDRVYGDEIPMDNIMISDKNLAHWLSLL